MILTVIAESTFTGTSVFVFFIVLFCATCLIYSLEYLIIKDKHDMGVKLIIIGILVPVIMLSVAPLEVNTQSELSSDTKPHSFNVQDYEYEHHTENVQVKVTNESVEEIKVFEKDKHNPIDNAERLENSSVIKLEIPDSSQVIIVTENENGNLVEKKRIKRSVMKNWSTIL